MNFSSESLRRSRPIKWEDRLAQHGLYTTPKGQEEDSTEVFFWSAEAGAAVRPGTGEAFICGTTLFDPLEEEASNA